MHAHTPLTREGCEQATEMGIGLSRHIEPHEPLALVSSPAGRTLQTLALVVEELDRDFDDNATDVRLGENHVGVWEGHFNKEIIAEIHCV